MLESEKDNEWEYSYSGSEDTQIANDGDDIDNCNSNNSDSSNASSNSWADVIGTAVGLACAIGVEKHFAKRARKREEEAMLLAEAEDEDKMISDDEEKMSKYELKTTLIIITVCFGVPLLLGLFFGLILPSCTNFANESAGMVQVGMSQIEFESENYKTAVAHLEAVGFTNIELVDLNDSGLAFWTDGLIKEVVIDGKASFDSDDWFDPDARIVIIYH